LKMSDSDLSYLLQSIPGSIANDYLLRTFQCRLPDKASPSVNLRFLYSNQSPPKSHLDAAKQFPRNCFSFSTDLRKNCFVILADTQEIGDILGFISQLDCRILHDQFVRELDSTHTPVFSVGKEVWTRDTPRIMAILNITPNSFYDGGKYIDTKNFEGIAELLIEEGADIIDIGGESSRPGSQTVSVDEEIRRVLPAVEQIRRRFQIPISVDTVKPEVAEVVLGSGATMINDISSLSAGSKMIDIIKKYKASYCLMHIKGTPDQMQKNPTYKDVIAEIYAFIKTKLETCIQAGIQKEKICIDPGIGFGKAFSHNLFLLRFLSAFLNLDQLILLGTSNKTFVGQALDRDVEDRLAGSLSTSVMGWLKGATIFRVHDVKTTHDSVRMARYYTHQ